MDDIKEVLVEEFKDKEARRQYAVDFLNSHIALQIKTLRQQRKWSQTQLAELAGKHQSQISAMESVDFSAWKISTLLKLAEAFDLALTVNFESFGNFLDDTTRLGREDLERPSFADDPVFQAAGQTGPGLPAGSEPSPRPHKRAGSDASALPCAEDRRVARTRPEARRRA